VERRHPSFNLAELIKLIHQNRVICGTALRPQNARPSSNGTQSGPPSAPQSRPPSAEAGRGDFQPQANGQPPHGSFVPNAPARPGIPAGLFQNLEGFLPAPPPARAVPTPPTVGIPSAPPPAPYIGSDSLNNSPTPEATHQRANLAEGSSSSSSPPESSNSYLPPHQADKIHEQIVPGAKAMAARATGVDPLEALARVERSSGYVPPQGRKVTEQAKEGALLSGAMRDPAMCAKCSVRQANIVSGSLLKLLV
jgi:hypothetical protein